MESEDAATSLDIALAPESEGSSDFHFRTRNDPASSFTRRTLVSNRRSGQRVRAKVALVAHGIWSLSDPAPVSLIVFDFDFIPGKAARRFKYAMVNITFKSLDPGSPSPSVSAIAPYRYTSIQRTKKTVLESHSLGASVSLATSGASVGGNVTWEKDKEWDTSSQAVVAGSIVASRGYGSSDSASWILRENSVTKTGIPAQLQVAMLLMRNKEDPKQEFLAAVELDTEVDLFSSITRMMGASPPNEPIIFNPTIRSSTPLPDFIKLEKLGELNLDDLVNISSQDEALALTA